MAIPVTLDDITRFPPLDTGLDRLFTGVRKMRTPTEIGREYNTEKYLGLLDAINAGRLEPNPPAIRLAEIGRDPNSPWCWVDRSRFLSGTLFEAQTAFDAWVAQSISERIGQARSVLDLGCGYGHHFNLIANAHPRVSFIGGDVSKNGLALGRAVYAGRPNVRFSEVDLNGDRLDIFTDLTPPVLVTTCFAVQQIAAAAPLIDLLSRHRDRIAGCVFLDPLYDPVDSSLVGRLRHAYAETCGYNLDLYASLKSYAGLAILECQFDVAGPNPLCPASLIHWKFL